MNFKQHTTKSLVSTTITFVFSCIIVTSAFGWGGPHAVITRAACKVLPEWQKEIWGTELKSLGDSYCLIPDQVYKGKEIAQYAMIDSKPGVIYLVSLHLPPETAEGYELLRFFMDKAVGSLKDNRVGDAARYTGTISHMLEDWGCPAHSAPDDNMFTLFKQFLPPPEKWEDSLLHSPIENGKFDVDLKDYKPRLLGTSVEEAAYIILHASHKDTVFARSQIVPIMQGLYNNDDDAVNHAQQKAALRNARMVADACYTLVCIAKGKVSPDEASAFQKLDISRFYPKEAPDFYFPQSSFFGKPYWGYSTTGKILKNGTEAMPLKLQLQKDKNTDIKCGIGTGTRSTLTYLIPTDVYKTFQVTAGLHPEFGANGSVIFEVKGDNRTLKKTEPLSGKDIAQLIEVPLAGVTNLQLIATSGSKDSSGNYAIWGEPALVK